MHNIHYKVNKNKNDHFHLHDHSENLPKFQVDRERSGFSAAT